MADPVFNPSEQNPQNSQPQGWVFGGNPDSFSSPEFVIHQDMFAGVPNAEVASTPVVDPFIAASVPTVQAPQIPVVETPVAPTPVVEVPTVQVPKTVSDLQKKFSELYGNISSLSTSLKLGDDETLDILGSDNDTQTTLYQFSTPSVGEVVIKKIETDKENEESIFNELKFSLDGDEGDLVVILDDMILFEEAELLEDAKKKSQVIEKMNKFIFLTGEKRKDIEREVKAKEEEEKERRRLQDIFRNF